MLSPRPALLVSLAALACLWTLQQVAALEGRESLEEKTYESEQDNAAMILGDSNLSGAPLQTAARDGNTEEILRLVDDGIDVNQVVDRVSALWIASALGREDVVAILLASEAKVDLVGPDGLTPLLAAAENGYDNIISMLLGEGADIEAKNKKGSTALILGTIGVHPRVVTVLVENHANVEAQSVTGVTSLLIAAYIGDLYIVKTLLDAGVDVENADSEGATPLFVAAQGGHELVVHELLQSGAIVGIPRMDGSSPLHAAAAGCHLAVVELLMDAEANPDFLDIFGQTPADHIRREKCPDENVLYAIEAILRPLFLASQEGNAWVVSTLLENGRDVNSVLMSNGRSPLHLASAHSRLDVTRVLVVAGADINVRDAQGARPIDILGSERPPESGEIDTLTRLLVGEEKRGEPPLVEPLKSPPPVPSSKQVPRKELDGNTFSFLSMIVLVGIGIVIGLVFACIGGFVLARLLRTRCEKTDCLEDYPICDQASASSRQVSSRASRGTHINTGPFHNPSYMSNIQSPNQLRRVGSDQILNIGNYEHHGSRRNGGHITPSYERQPADSRGSYLSRSSAGTQVPGTPMLENAVDREPSI